MNKKTVFYHQKEQKLLRSTVYPANYLKLEAVEYLLTDFQTGAVLQVEYEKRPDSVCIRPASLGLSCVLEGNRVTVQIDRPCHFSLEINGGTEDALLVFLHGEEKLRREQYQHCIYFGPGEHRADVIEIEQDSTIVYLDEGAYVHGKILAEGKNHIAVGGRGVLSMERYERCEPYRLMVELNHCRDVELEGITLTDSCMWSCRLFGCEQVHVDRLKIFGQRGNSDGIDICGSRHVLVEGCFTRVWDDSLVVKAFDTGDVEDVVCKDCTLWNDFARPIEVGVELRADQVHQVRFSNIDIIHSPTGYPVMGIHHGDRAQVSDICFEDIRVEDTPGAQLFDIRITNSVWNDSTTIGSIRNVRFERIFVGAQTSSMSPSRIEGYSPEVTVKGVTLSDICFDGRYARDLESCGVDVRNYAEDVKISAHSPYLEMVQTRLEQREFCLQEDGFYHGSILLTLKNCSREEQRAELSVHAAPSFRAEPTLHRVCQTLAGGEQKEVELAFRMPPGKFCLHTDSVQPNVEVSWLLVDLPMVLRESYATYRVVNCRGEEAGSIGFAWHKECLEVKSELLKKEGVTLYAACPVETEKNQVLFSVEETDFGKAPAVINGPQGPELAPQLRCPAEITYVFQNEPKTKIVKWDLRSRLAGEASVPLALLGIDPSAKEFWLEVSVEAEFPARYPVCLFGSQVPEEICHMFVRVVKE